MVNINGNIHGIHGGLKIENKSLLHLPSNSKIIRSGLFLFYDSNNRFSLTSEQLKIIDLSYCENNGNVVNSPDRKNIDGVKSIYTDAAKLQYINLGNLQLNYPFNISFACKVSSIEDFQISFVNPGVYNKFIAIDIMGSLRQIRISYYNSSYTGFSVSNINYNQFYYVSGNFTSTGFDLYVNGIYAGSLGGAKAKTWTDTSESYNINRINGTSAPGATRPIFASSNIYNALIYNRTLTLGEIKFNHEILKKILKI